MVSMIIAMYPDTNTAIPKKVFIKNVDLILCKIIYAHGPYKIVVIRKKIWLLITHFFSLFIM
jgi:hypothetical protein